MHVSMGATALHPVHQLLVNVRLEIENDRFVRFVPMEVGRAAGHLRALRRSGGVEESRFRAGGWLLVERCGMKFDRVRG